MRVLQVTPRYLPSTGGIEIVVQKISEKLVERGLEVIVYSVDRNSNLASVENINGVIVKRFTALLGDPLFLPDPKFVASMREENADVIHVHNIHTLPPLIVALLRHNNQKLLLQPHYHKYGQSPIRNSFFELYKKTSYHIMFSRTNAIITNSLHEKEIFNHDFPFTKNLILLPEGIDIQETILVKHMPAEPKRILYIGTLRGYKNVDKVLDGFAYLVKNGNHDFKLVIVGNGPERKSLVNLAFTLGISEVVEWKSHLSRQQLLDEYVKASVFIMLSPLESFSRVVYEALIVGVPVVVLNFGVLGHLVSDGFVEGVNSTDPKSVATALEKATQKSYPKISLHSNVFLDWNSYVDKLVKVYEKL